MGGMNLGYRTAEQIRERMEASIAQINADARMLCDELQMQEASYEMLLEERKILLLKIADRDADIKRLKADLVAEKEHWRMLCDVIAKSRDDARREVCELDANGSLEAGTPTTVAGDRGWSYLYENSHTVDANA